MYRPICKLYVTYSFKFMCNQREQITFSTQTVRYISCYFKDGRCVVADRGADGRADSGAHGDPIVNYAMRTQPIFAMRIVTRFHPQTYSKIRSTKSRLVFACSTKKLWNLYFVFEQANVRAGKHW